MLAVLALALASPAVASSVEPTVVPGNPSCADLGYDFGYKPQPEPPPTGTYTFPDGINTVTITSDGTYFDWASTLGIDAVIVKGGSNANEYAYDPPAESLGDTGLSSPINPNTNIPYAISHIEFCYDYEVDVTKDATTTFTRTYEWDITKTVSPETWDLFTGDSSKSEYTVKVKKIGYTDSDWSVSGDITIENNTPFDATIAEVTDVVSPSIEATVNCGALVVFPYTLASGGTLTCTYESLLPDGTNRTNTATVTTNKTANNPVGGNTGTADVIFGNPTTEVNKEINVTDTNGMSWGPVAADKSWNYEVVFDCEKVGENLNTATIIETEQSDDATVTVACYNLNVTKDAKTSFDRDWTWTIDKSADQSALTLSIGQQFLVNFSVGVGATSADSNWAVEGEITISNPHPTRAAALTTVSDLVSPDIAATVDCPALSVPADNTLTCTYSTALPDASSRTNTATATLQNYDFASNGTPTAAGTTAFSGSADVTFSDTPTNEYDECIEVSDTNVGNLGTACASTSPTTFLYQLHVGPYDACGTYAYQNTASFITNDNEHMGSDTWNIDINIPCAGGCTLTQGYWKTHSEYGPAPYDDTWALLPNGANTPFFLSGQSYYEVLWTPPAGNVYYSLAHQYIAAKLNLLNGADASAVQDAFDEATDLFATYTPAQIAGVKGKDKKTWTDLVTILDEYNNGLIGPGHCSEEGTSSSTQPVSVTATPLLLPVFTPAPDGDE